MTEPGPGDVVGGYRIETVLGRGALATVYLAVSRAGRRVALRIPRMSLAHDPAFREQFARAARESTRLRHPYVVEVLEVGEAADDLPFVVMETVDGPSLAERIRTGGPMPRGRAAEVTIKLAAGVASAHSVGIAHGALIPSNVLFAGGAAADPKLEGFGDPALPQLTTTRGDLARGRIEYLAPERLKGAAPSVRADVYGLGGLLYTSVTGKAPFEAATRDALESQVLNEPPPHLPPEADDLDAVVRRAMSKHPDQRFGSASKFREAVEDATREGVVRGRIRGTASQVRAEMPLERLESAPVTRATRGRPRIGRGSRRRNPPPPRTMYPRLDADSVAVAQQEFDLTVGVSPTQDPGVAGGKLRLPDSVKGQYELSIHVIADGFGLREDESWRHTFQVTGDDPYPMVTLHLTPEAQDDDFLERGIRATYSADGQTMGFAVRAIVVVRDPAFAPEEPKQPSGADLTIDTSTPAPDLTVNITKGKEEFTGRWMWTFESPHPIELPDDPIDRDIGSKPDDFAKDLVAAMPNYEGDTDQLYAFIAGKGEEVSAVVPPDLWRLLTAAAKHAKRAGRAHPTVLIASEEPYVPWELAKLDDPLDPDLAPFLCIQAAVGRWIIAPDNKPPPKPPPTAQAGRMVVISGVYDAPGLRRLVAAEEEAAALKKAYKAKFVEARAKLLLDCLKGKPRADVIHLAIHGKWEKPQYGGGLLMLDGKAVVPTVIKGVTFKNRPFVFLNACQLGAADAVLGNHAGTAEAFLSRGAPAVVAALWSIDDKVAKGIALAFYESVLKDGVPAAEALRKAREGFLEDPPPTSATSMAFRFFGHPAMELHRKAKAAGRG